MEKLITMYKIIYVWIILCVVVVVVIMVDFVVSLTWEILDRLFYFVFIFIFNNGECIIDLGPLRVLIIHHVVR